MLAVCVDSFVCTNCSSGYIAYAVILEKGGKY